MFIKKLFCPDHKAVLFEGFNVGAFDVCSKAIYLFIVDFVRFLINIYMKQLGIYHAIFFFSEVTRELYDFFWKQE